MTTGITGGAPYQPPISTEGNTNVPTLADIQTDCNNLNAAIKAAKPSTGWTASSVTSLYNTVWGENNPNPPANPPAQATSGQSLLKLYDDMHAMGLTDQPISQSLNTMIFDFQAAGSATTSPSPGDFMSMVGIKIDDITNYVKEHTHS